jgi:uroporphyrinogen III methyltransferase/synthase
VSKPLKAKRVLVTRASEQSQDFSRLLAEAGAIPIELPLIHITPPDDPKPLRTAIDQLTDYDWLIFTSANGVRFFFEALRRAGKNVAEVKPLRVAVIGPATATELAEHSLKVDIMASEHTAEGLLEAMPPVDGQRILLPTADIARPTLADSLRSQGAVIDQVVAYQNKPAPAPANLRDLLPTLEILTFTSSSTVRNFMTMLPDPSARQTIQSAIVAVIGPKTAATAVELGLTVHIVADSHTIPGLIEALIAYYTPEQEARV